MFNSCKLHIDYSERRETIKSGIIHATSKSRESACGRYFSSPYESKWVNNTAPITCKSCLKALSANDTDVTVNTANLFVIRTNEGLFIDKDSSLTSNISNARIFKIEENAKNAIKEFVYVNKYTKEVLNYNEFIKTTRACVEKRNEYIREARPKKGLNIVPVTLSFNESECSSERRSS